MSRIQKSTSAKTTARSAADRKRSLAAKKGSATRARNRALASRRQLRLHHKLIAATAILAVLVLAFLGIRSQLDTYAASTAIGTFTTIGGKCLDNQHSVAANHNRIQIYGCNGTNAQKWTVTTTGAIVSGNGNGQYCLDIPGSNTAQYTYLQLYRCNGTKAQKFKVQNNQIISVLTGYCATVRYAETANGTRVWMKACHGSAAQNWVYSAKTTPAPAPSTGASGTGSGTQPSGAGITPYQNLSGATFSKRINAAGASALVSLPSGTYAFNDFADGQTGTFQGASEYGAWITTKGLLGAGVGKTILEMSPNSSSKKAAVPPDCGGGLGCPTNNLYLVKVSAPGAKVDGLTIVGTSQGHLYNGLRFESVASGTLSNVKVTDIPGDSGANPGETFSVNFNRCSGTTTVSNVTIDGGNVAAAGIATNSCSGTINVDGLTTTNLAHSAGIALWQQTGTVNIRNWTNSNSARALGAESLGGTVNLYDPNWGTSKIGHDITYTPYAGHSGNRINIYYSSAAKAARKIIILTNTAAVKSTVYVYINNVEQNQANYITWQGA